MDCKFSKELNSILKDRFISELMPSPILDRLFKNDTLCRNYFRDSHKKEKQFKGLTILPEGNRSVL